MAAYTCSSNPEVQKTVPGAAHNEAHKTRRPPLQIRQFSYGWSVIYYGPDGHVRHLVSVDDEVRAFRTARQLVRMYHLQGDMLVHSQRGNYLYSISKLLDEATRHHE